MIDMVKKEIIPAVMEYTTTVAKSVAAVKAVGADASVQEKVLKEITTELSKLDASVVKLEAATDAICLRLKILRLRLLHTETMYSLSLQRST